jgi:hypothetical protein
MQHFDQKVPHNEVKQEIFNWIVQVLSVPTPHFNNIPPCPCAKPALDAGRVDVRVGGRGTIMDAVDYWPPEVDIVVVVPINRAVWEWDEIEDWCRDQNRILEKSDFILVPFVPNGDAPKTNQPDVDCDWANQEWDWLVDEDYPMIFLQRRSELIDASNRLRLRGYYKNVPPKYLRWVDERNANGTRNERRNAKGQEEARNEKEGSQG